MILSGSLPFFSWDRYSGSLTQTLRDLIIPNAKVEVFPCSIIVMYPVSSSSLVWQGNDHYNNIPYKLFIISLAT
jgi:hypothetical protein